MLWCIYILIELQWRRKLLHFRYFVPAISLYLIRLNNFSSNFHPSPKEIIHEYKSARIMHYWQFEDFCIFWTWLVAWFLWLVHYTHNTRFHQTRNYMGLEWKEGKKFNGKATKCSEIISRDNRRILFSWINSTFSCAGLLYIICNVSCQKSVKEISV